MIYFKLPVKGVSNYYSYNSIQYHFYFYGLYSKTSYHIKFANLVHKLYSSFSELNYIANFR